MRLWRGLVSGCWFAHDFIRERDEQGRFLLVCQSCGASQRPDLTGETLKGPAHQPADVLGQPKEKAVREKWFVRRKVG